MKQKRKYALYKNVESALPLCLLMKKCYWCEVISLVFSAADILKDGSETARCGRATHLCGAEYFNKVGTCSADGGGYDLLWPLK